MKNILYLFIILFVFVSCKKENNDVTSSQRQQTYYTSVVFNNPVRLVDSVAWNWIWPQVIEDPLNFSFTIISGRESDGPLKVNSWKVTIDGTLVKQSATKKDLSYPQVITIDVPNIGVVAPYRGDVTKTWHLISVYFTHTDGSSYGDGIYFYK